MYRDCVPEPNKAGFENPLIMAVAKSDGTYYRKRFNMGSPVVTKLSNEITNKCLILPPGLCVEEGVYTNTIDLPIDSVNSYLIVFQRCCRNATIFNIINPGDFGDTFLATITPESQKLKNSSPVFKEFPPIAVCVDYGLAFDHSATDIDGDSLTYEFVSPLHGGGSDPFGSGCNALTPDPPCLPPYTSLTYRFPFSPQDPMGGNPIINIDLTTGFLSGKPEIIGQFVVGVKVNEYRNGKLIGEVFRDFQFNVTECYSNTQALLEDPKGIINDSIVVIKCGDNRVNIKNKSITTGASIFEWELYLNKQPLVYTTKDLIIDVDTIGTFPGQLIINRGTECSDTAFFTLIKNKKTVADFSFAYDSCMDRSISFTNKSYAEDGNIIKYDWSIDGTKTSVKKDFESYPDSNGIYDVKLVSTNSNGCVDSITIPVNYESYFIDTPALSGAKYGCIPFITNLRVKNLDPSEYDFQWFINNEPIGKGENINYPIDKEGAYTLSYLITDKHNCKLSGILPDKIEAYKPPKADFEIAPTEITNRKPNVQLTDKSINAREWQYRILTDTLNGPNQKYSFRDTGLTDVTLIVTAGDNCKDTLTKRIDVVPFNSIYLPTAFTPDLDGKNDVYLPAGINSSFTEYHLTIYSRWGDVIFESDKWDEGWKGTDRQGTVLPAGTYVAKVSVKTRRGQTIEKTSSVTLIR
jgi:gliding motility-associated-like protein